MRVGVDARHLRGGRGIAQYTRELLIALRTQFPEDDWLPLLPRGRRGTADAGGVPVTSTKVPSRLLFGAAALTGRPRLDRLLGGRVDVVWLPAPAPVAVSRDVPYVLTVHDLAWLERPRDFEPYERLYHALARVERLVRRARLVLTVSEQTRAALLERWSIPPERVRVVQPGVPIQSADGPAPPGLPRRFLLFVGAVEPRKDPELLVQAFLRARASNALDAELVVVGSGRLAPRLRAPGVHLLGHTEHLGSVYARALALAMPSHLEGFGFPPLEAALAGVPSVVSDLPVFDETLGDAALRVPTRDPDAWGEALVRIAGDAPLRERLGREARARARRLSWPRAAREVRAALSEAAGM